MSLTKPRAFISYSRKDQELISSIIAQLNTLEIEVIIDKEIIEISEKWWDRIKDNIIQSHYVIFFSTANSLKSKVCLDEIKFSVENSLQIIPVIINSLQQFFKNPILSQYHYFDATSLSLEQIIEKINIEIKKNISNERKLTDLRTSYVNWNNAKKDKSFLLRGTRLSYSEKQFSEFPKKDEKIFEEIKSFISESRNIWDKEMLQFQNITIKGFKLDISTKFANGNYSSAFRNLTICASMINNFKSLSSFKKSYFESMSLGKRSPEIVLNIFDGLVVGIAVNLTNTKLAVGYSNGTAIIYDFPNWKILIKKNLGSEIQKVLYNSVTDQFIWIGCQGEINKCSSDLEILQIGKLDIRVMQVDLVSENGTLYIRGGSSKNGKSYIFILDINNNQLLWSHEIPDTYQIIPIFQSRDSLQLSPYNISRIDHNTNKKIYELKTSYSYSSYTWSPDGKTIALAEYKQNSIQLFEISKGVKTNEIYFETNIIKIEFADLLNIIIEKEDHTISLLTFHNTELITYSVKVIDRIETYTHTNLISNLNGTVVGLSGKNVYIWSSMTQSRLRKFPNTHHDYKWPWVIPTFDSYGNFLISQSSYKDKIQINHVRYDEKYLFKITLGNFRSQPKYIFDKKSKILITNSEVDKELLIIKLEEDLSLIRLFGKFKTKPIISLKYKMVSIESEGDSSWNILDRKEHFIIWDIEKQERKVISKVKNGTQQLDLNLKGQLSHVEINRLKDFSVMQIIRTSNNTVEHRFIKINFNSNDIEFFTPAIPEIITSFVYNHFTDWLYYTIKILKGDHYNWQLYCCKVGQPPRLINDFKKNLVRLVKSSSRDTFLKFENSILYKVNTENKLIEITDLKNIHISEESLLAIHANFLSVASKTQVCVYDLNFRVSQIIKLADSPIACEFIDEGNGLEIETLFESIIVDFKNLPNQTENVRKKIKNSSTYSFFISDDTNDDKILHISRRSKSKYSESLINQPIVCLYRQLMFGAFNLNEDDKKNYLTENFNENILQRLEQELSNLSFSDEALEYLKEMKEEYLSNLYDFK